MDGWWELIGVGFVAAVFLYIAITTWFDSSISSRGTTRNRGLFGERGDEYRDRSAL